MKIVSPDFEPNGPIPKEFTCQGGDASPALVLEGVPAVAKSLALLMDDPDAPMGTFVHWVVFDIPAAPRVEIRGNTAGGVEGRNSFGRGGYGGPCPPSGTHRYFFKVYALDATLGLSGSTDKKALERAMKGHVLAEAELMGTYRKQ